MTMKKFLPLMSLLCVIAPAVYTQDADNTPDVSQEIEAIRAATAAERKILIMKEMNMTAAEAERFWPLYDDYQKEVKIVGDLRVRIITDYAASYTTMTNELAEELLDEHLDYMDQKQKLTRKYIKKFRTILPDIKVTRYFQLEHKLDAVVDFELATRIPLME